MHQSIKEPYAKEIADLKWQASVLGTMQRLIVGLFQILSSVSGVLIGGMQRAGSILVPMPDEESA